MGGSPGPVVRLVYAPRGRRKYIDRSLNHAALLCCASRTAHVASKLPPAQIALSPGDVVEGGIIKVTASPGLASIDAHPNRRDLDVLWMHICFPGDNAI